MTSGQLLVFNTAFESLRRVAEPFMSDALATELARAGVDLRDLKPAYDFEVWRAATAIVARVRKPELEREEALFALGQAFVELFTDGLVGKALFGVLRVIGTRRALHRLTRNFRTTNNFSDAVVTDVGPTQVRIDLNLVAHPSFERGVLVRGLELAGARDVTVEIEQREPSIVYVVRWRG